MLQFPENYFKKEIRSNTIVSETTKRHWAAQLEVLQKIDVICKKYKLQYYAYWGSLLGTVRHAGFIPWDDDFDIAMLKDDYIKFLSVAQQELPEDYWLLNIYTTKQWENAFSRVANGSSIDLKKTRNKEYQGCPLALGVDIFPLYYIPRNKKEAENQKAILTVIGKLLSVVGYRYNNPDITEEEIQKYDLLIAQNLVDIERITGYKFTTDRPLKNQLTIVYDQISRIGTAGGSDYVASFVHYVGKNKHILDKNIFKPVMKPFENILVPIPEGYDTVLRQMYGEYMIERKSNSLDRHNAIKLQTQELGEMLENSYLHEINNDEDVHVSVHTQEYMDSMSVSYEEALQKLPQEWVDKLYIINPDGSKTKRKVVFYYTNIGPMLTYSGYTMEKVKKVLDTFERHPEVLLWWMPCRLDGEMMEILDDYVPEMKAEYKQLMDEYVKEGWGILDNRGDLSIALDMSDAYYGDEGLISPVVQKTGKKMMYQDYKVTSELDRKLGNIIDDDTEKTLTKADGIDNVYVENYKDALEDFILEIIK